MAVSGSVTSCTDDNYQVNTMNRQLLQKALEALTNTAPVVESDYEGAVRLYQDNPDCKDLLKELEETMNNHKEVIRAVREELDKPAPIPVAYLFAMPTPAGPRIQISYSPHANPDAFPVYR